MPEQEVIAPTDILNKLSQALVLVSRGDPLVALRHEIQTQLKSIETRFEAIDKATVLQHADTVRVPTLVDKATSALRDVLEQTMHTHAAINQGRLERLIAETAEKFAKVDVMFSENNKREHDLSVARELALTNALNAAKEAVSEQNKANTTAIAKSENSVAEQLKQMQTTNDQASRATNEKIDDLKSRLDRGEGTAAGGGNARTERRLDAGLMVAIAAAAFALAAIAVPIFHSPAAPQPVVSYVPAPTAVPAPVTVPR